MTDVLAEQRVSQTETEIDRERDRERERGRERERERERHWGRFGRGESAKLNKSSKPSDADDCRRRLGDRRPEEAERETSGRLAAAAAGSDASVSSCVSLMKIYCNHPRLSDAARKIVRCIAICL